MTIPKLTYFHVRARGQFPRVLLTYLNVKFEDIKIYKDEIPQELKSKLLFGQLPLYQDGEIELVQTASIMQYISEKNNFAGKSLIEKSKVIEAFCGCYDVVNSILTAMFTLDDKGRERFQNNNKISFYLDTFEKLLKKNKFIAGGDAMTYADISVYITYDYAGFLGYVKSVYPKLDALKQSIESIPSIKAYKDSLPETDH